jgi:hypothetical protein
MLTRTPRAPALIKSPPRFLRAPRAPAELPAISVSSLSRRPLGSATVSWFSRAVLQVERLPEVLPEPRLGVPQQVSLTYHRRYF